MYKFTDATGKTYEFKNLLVMCDFLEESGLNAIRVDVVMKDIGMDYIYEAVDVVPTANIIDELANGDDVESAFINYVVVKDSEGKRTILVPEGQSILTAYPQL